jgi:DHA2 family multidrug resistance protein
LEASIAGIAFYVFLVQLWLAPKGFLSPRLFTDLNFVMGLVFIFLIGLLLFATLALMAPYLQTLMNYPVVTAGICLAPRGIGTMLAMLLCGRLVGKMDVRILFAIGLGASAFVLYRMSAWTPDVSESAIIGTGILQGFGIGFVFVPLSVTSFATLPVALRTEATGIFSLIRDLGSSIGISITSALLLTNTHINHAIIVAAVTPFSRALQTGAAHYYWNPGLLAGAAALDAVITRQATIIAYADDFRLMLLLSLLALPLIVLIRMPSSAAPAR